jgi:hypothetical protein
MTTDPGLPAEHDPLRLTKENGTGPPSAFEPSTTGTAPRADRRRRRTSHRPWSQRRIPAALTALVILAASGAALYDVIAVRAGRPAAAWRRNLADELASRPVDDVWMLTGAAVAAALGLWLIILALTPGLRHALPVRSPDSCLSSRLRATLDRDGAAAVLRDAAMRVPGVSRARVRVRRHRIKARADVRFRDPHQVHDDLTTALREERDQLALTPPPHLTVRVRHRTP